MDDTVKLEKSERFLRLRNAQGKNVCVVREVYRRDVVPCQSPLCLGPCENDDVKLVSLPSDVTYYLVPDCSVAREFLEILELPEITGIIFTQTVVHSVQYEGSRRHVNRLKNVVKDGRKGSIIFHNEFQRYSSCDREAGEPLDVWQARNTYNTAEWYFHHLAGQISIVMLTHNKQIKDLFANKTTNVFVLSVEEYLQTFWLTVMPDIMDLYQSIALAAESKSKCLDYRGYYPSDALEAGLKSGQFLKGFLHVNKQNASQEAFVKRLRVDMKEESKSDILISGMSERNRSIHGDLVVVQILPRSQWEGRSLALHGNQEENNVADSADDQLTDAMPTGRVLGILQRNWRDYVCSFSKDEETGKGDNKAGKVLVIPWDYRIPKIRISTRQVDKLRDHRIIVRIDSWEVESQYPNGHFVHSLGKIGDLEAEIAAILVENSISVGQFSQAQTEELPSNSTDSPWQVDKTEVENRRDLRDSHLIFSIDPKGCEDVDDTLSVRTLENGNTELGVHIADVTHFVRPGMLTDMEARSRSTTVYLADRRFDMLPSVLSADLCSLISNVDRYAVSVIWELDKTYEVVHVWYGRSIIRSKYKLFYEFAQAIHDGMEDEEMIQNIAELENASPENLSERIMELRSAINQLMEVSRNLRQRRTKDGALELENIEVQVQLSETKSIQDLTPKDHMEIHETVEECMIFANHWVAKKIAQAFPNQALLRHHPLPKTDHFEDLKNCAAVRGFQIKTSSNKELAHSLNAADDINDPVVNKILRTLATRAMSVAEYFSTGSLSCDQFFHYGLAVDFYTHFTSPIRRYADVIVHRQLLVSVGVMDPSVLMSNNDLDDMANHINKKHRTAQYAQRDSQELFQCLFFKDRGPENECSVVDAVIFQIRTNGLYVYIPRYGCNGPMYLRDKAGCVVYFHEDDIIEWIPGNLTRTDQSITVNCMYGRQTYSLLDHVTIKITLLDSWAHSSSLRLELVCKQPKKWEQATSAKSQKSVIIEEVSAIAEEKKAQIDSYELEPNFCKLNEMYGQTPTEGSLYELFESFKEMALFSK